jgi:hypothetical protein
LGHANGKFLTFQRILELNRDWNSYKYNWRRTHGGSIKERGGDEIERFESKKLSLSIHLSYYYGNNLEQRLCKRNMGFNASKISRVY